VSFFFVSVDRHIDETVATSIADIAAHAGSVQLDLLLGQSSVLDETTIKLTANSFEARKHSDYCDKRGLLELGGYARRVESLVDDVARLIQDACIVRMVSAATTKHAAITMHDVYVTLNVELYAMTYRTHRCPPSSDVREAVYLAQTLAELSAIARIIRIKMSLPFGSTILQQCEQPFAECEGDGDEQGQIVNFGCFIDE
jgi:hypothetical protein